MVTLGGGIRMVKQPAGFLPHSPPVIRDFEVR